jgi:hypothetical protein
MNIIGAIKNKLKILLSDLRRHLGLIFIITFIWILLLIGIVFLAIYVGPLEAGSIIYTYIHEVWFIDLMTGVVQVGMAGTYVLVWLYIWQRMVRMYFWRTIEKYMPSIEISPEEKK